MVWTAEPPKQPDLSALAGAFQMDSEAVQRVITNLSDTEPVNPAETSGYLCGLW